MTDAAPTTVPVPLLADPTPIKPGYQTTEFWLSLAATALTVLFASGALTSSTSLAIAGMAATVLTALGYKVSRTLVKMGAVLLLVLGLAVAPLGAGCGGSQSSRAATIGSIDSGLMAAAAALRTYEHARAEDVIAHATSLEAGRASLAALRTRTTPAWKAVDAAESALKSANHLNDDPSLKGAQDAIAIAIAAVAAITGGTAP